MGFLSMKKLYKKLQHYNFRIFKVKDDSVMFVYRDEDKNFKYIIFQPELFISNGITRIPKINYVTSNRCLYREDDYLYALFNKIYPCTFIPSLDNCPVLAGYYTRLIKDLSICLVGTDIGVGILPYNCKDSSGCTLKDWLLDCFGYYNLEGIFTLGISIETLII